MKQDNKVSIEAIYQSSLRFRKQFNQRLVVCRLLEDGLIKQQNYYPISGRLGDVMAAGFYTNMEIATVVHLNDGWELI